MTVTIFESPTHVSLEQLNHLPFQSVAMGWNGQALPQPLQWAIVRDPKWFWFVASLSGGTEYDPQHSSGDFIEGLWERDVAEIFIKESSGRYQEFNVSPGGAWWTVVLSSYRTRETTIPELREPVIRAELGEGQWRVVLGVELSCLAVELSESSTVHVSGISHKPQRVFISSCPVSGVEPDFHHPKAFMPVRFHALA